MRCTGCAEDLAAFLLFAVGRADLDKLRLRGDLLGDVCANFGLIAAWVGASVLLAEVGKQQLVMACPLWAIDATSRDGHKMRVALVERGVFEEEQDVLLNPELQAPHGKQDALGLAVARCAPVFTEASRERLFLLVGWQLGQQERMTDADFIAIERFDRCRNEVDQFEPGGNEGRWFSCLRGDLLDGVGRLFQIEQAP